MITVDGEASFASALYGQLALDCLEAATAVLRDHQGLSLRVDARVDARVEWSRFKGACVVVDVGERRYSIDFRPGTPGVEIERDLRAFVQRCVG